MMTYGKISQANTSVWVQLLKVTNAKGLPQYNPDCCTGCNMQTWNFVFRYFLEKKIFPFQFITLFHFHIMVDALIARCSPFQKFSLALVVLGKP